MLGKHLGKKTFKKKWKRERGGASRPQPRFWPVGRSRPSPRACLPCPRARARVHARWPAAPCRRGEPAGLYRCVARMRRGGHALVGHREPPVTLASPSSSIRACPLPLSHSHSPEQPQRPRHRSPLPPTLGAPLLASSGLLLRILGHQRLRLAFPHPARTLNHPR